MNVQLIVEKDGKPSQAFQLRSSETVIGRRRGCDLRIPSSAVSRRHCLISIRQGAVLIEDLSSVNGTFVNGKRLKGKQLVYPGDRLDVGPVKFVVQYTKSAAAPPRPAPAAKEDEEVPELEPAEASDSKPLKILDDSDTDEQGGDVIAEIDEAGGLKLPENEELRDLLAQMDEPRPGKKKSR